MVSGQYRNGLKYGALGGLLVVFCLAGWRWWQQRDLKPLTTAAAARLPLPAGTIVLRAADARTVTAPLVREAPRPTDDSGTFLALPEAGGANNDKGSAEFGFTVPAAGTWFAWLRCRWSNACGNSVALAVDNQARFTAGQDVVYDSWHWVRAGRWNLAAGAHTAVILGREDGVELAEVLFSPVAEFVPGGTALPPGRAADLRRTGDDFDRSPGHGLEPWEPLSGKWDIAFSLDPNRIPNQYALTGRCGTNLDPAVILLSGDPWDGVRVSFSFCPLEAGSAGVLLGVGQDHRAALTLALETTETGATLRLTAVGVQETRSLGDRVRLKQWHRVTVERWAWVLRVLVDDELVFPYAALPPAGAIGFVVNSGVAAFDDVLVEEIPWQAEDGRTYTIPWAVSPGAKWFRSASRERSGLYGAKGEISTSFGNLPVQAVMLNEPWRNRCRIVAPVLRQGFSVWPLGYFLFQAPGYHGELGRSLVLAPEFRPSTLRGVAVAYGYTPPERFTEGPYHFTSPTLEDPSDYLDFTPEEARQTTDPAQADKLKREMKTFRIVGPAAESSAWCIENGVWEVRDGVLRGTGSGVVRYWRDLYGSIEFRGRVRLTTPGAVAGVELYRGKEPGACFRLSSGGAASDLPDSDGSTVAVAADGNWHELRLTVNGRQVVPMVDRQAGKAVALPVTLGGTALLRVAGGTAEFDDVEFSLPRRAKNEFLYVFDRRETDWWRTGGEWIDHGGISCALASQWISLVAPEGSGILWNKRGFPSASGADLLVTATLEENTEWFGWHQAESHIHHPYDNVCIYLTQDNNPETGYRVELNARQRTATVLYRNNVEVATVRQDSLFPLQYVGGHVPYSPRRSRLAVVKRGGTVAVVLNGREILSFADPAPLPVSRVGVGGYQTRVNFSRVEIREW